MFQTGHMVRQAPAISVLSGTPRQALRKATDATHRRLHNLPSFAALLNGSLSRAGYQRLLLRLLGLHAPLDERQGEFGNEPLLEWTRAAPEGSRAELLRRDLRMLGVSDGEIRSAPRADDLLPRPASPAEALGCAWVIEGSAMGGRVIAKLLNEHLGIGQATGGAFFVQGPWQQARWAACCDAVESCGQQIVACAAMQAAADATMRAFACWMEADMAA